MSHEFLIVSHKFTTKTEQESHFNEISYLKPGILIKKIPFRIFLGPLLLITFQADYFWLHISSNKHAVSKKGFLN